jgi:hypothetical protein
MFDNPDGLVFLKKGRWVFAWGPDVEIVKTKSGPAWYIYIFVQKAWLDAREENLAKGHGGT